jgi:hypothetical protein
MLFEPPHEELSDEAVAAVLRQLQGGSLGMPICFSPASCVEHLVDGLRAAGLLVMRPAQWRLHP